MPEPSADDPTFGPASGSAPRGRGRRLLLYVGVVLAAAVVVLGGYVLLGNSGEQPSRLEIAERALGQALLQTDVMVMETGELPIFDPAQLIDYTSYRQDTILAGPGIVGEQRPGHPLRDPDSHGADAGEDRLAAADGQHRAGLAG